MLNFFNSVNYTCVTVFLTVHELYLCDCICFDRPWGWVGVGWGGGSGVGRGGWVEGGTPHPHPPTDPMIGQ